MLVHVARLLVCLKDTKWDHTPLDDVPFGGLKKAYQREILDYNFHFSAKKLSKLELFRVLVPAYTKSMSEKAISSGYQFIDATLFWELKIA